MADQPEPSQTGGETDQIREHHYDGIQEYDNALPRWWLTLFYLSIVWAIGYMIWYHVMNKPVGPAQLQQDLAELAELRAKNQTGPLSEDALRALSTSPERIAKGAALYASTGCTTCHGADGTGGVGPNLRDVFWIHGSALVKIVEVIHDGAANNQMPAQKNNMLGDDIHNLAILLVDWNRKGSKAGKAIDPTKELEDPIRY